MAITLNYITTATQTTGGSSLTFSDVSIGSASADRVVVVAICSESNVPETFSGGTIGGNSATEAVVVEGTSSTVGTIVAILYLAVPTGTTATIVSNYSGSVFRGICSVWTLTGDTPELIDIDTDTAPSGTGLSCSVDIPANAVGIAGYSQGNTFEVTWTGATERFDESVSGGSRFSTADVPAIGSDRNGHTVSVSHSNSTQTISEAVAVFTSGTPPPVTINRFTGADNSSLAWSTINPSAGDLVIVAFANDGGDDQSTPGGLIRLDANSGTSVESGVYYRVCTGSETGNLIASEGTFGVSGEEYCWHVFHIPDGDWDSDFPPELQAAGGGGTTGTINPPSLSPSWGSEDNNIWIVVAIRDDDDGISSLGSDYTSNFDYTRSASSTGSCEIASSWRLNTAASENPGSASQTNTNEEWIAYTIGVKPSSGLEEKEAATTISLELDTSGDSTKEGIASSGINLELDVSSLISKDTSTSTSLDLNISTSSIAAKAIEASTDVELEVDTSGGATKNGSGIGNFPIEVDLSGSITNKNSSIVADLDLEIDISGDAEATKISASSIDLEFDTDVLSVKSGITATDLDILLDFDSDANLKTASASTSLDVELDIDNSSSVGIRDLFVVVNHAGVKSFTHSVGVVDVPIPVDANLQSIDVSATDGVNNITTSVGKDDSVEVDSAAIRPGVSGVGI